ncbi:MAG: Stp1/IreP family PP2C-type Ser/Thr phosphatase [Desulfobacula sp.]|uniref:Stp1/IreP family PP2C-type Ser/Thr phosphatase n=1 Tax=Desulfobacula sp. TaxID=2593537 RepID=UPI0025BCF38B|nr:Stp1/IreP family PP2C-type Ser/Thr phosphatase [Desulfobacula sp.]MCD4721607.1 Stp1/IreP family PP2C-type Ser/Thr phosphatase [Desulfobacula sp.]
MAGFFLFGKTDKGLRRKKNEDTFLVNEEKGFCLVADGIGGAAEGDIASQIFARTAQEVFSRKQDTDNMESELVQKTFQIANDSILRYAENNSARKGMGCTAELLAFSSNRFVLGHMGDSRAYRLRRGKLKQLTTDHSLVQEQLDQGMITKAEATHHSFKNVILRAVGIKKNPSLDILRGNIISGDLFLLCSDGLTDMIEDSLIKKHMDSRTGIEEKVENLIHEANANGGKDNISVVMAEILSPSI